MTRTRSSQISPSIELIDRGPDGRFVVPTYEHDTMSIHSKKSLKYDQFASVRRSVSLRSDKEDRKGPFVLSVDLPLRKQANSSSQISGTIKHLPDYDPYIMDQKSHFGGFPDLRSLCSTSSFTTLPHQDRNLSPTFPVLPHIRSSLGQPSTTASALVLQMEHERERGNLSHCLKLAQEREELEKELQKYTLQRNSTREMRMEQPDSENEEGDGGYEHVWNYKSSTLPHRYSQGSKESFGFSNNPFSSPSVHWEGRPLVSPSPRTSLNVSGNHHLATLPFTKQTPLLSEEAGSVSKERLTLPRLSSKHQRHERVEAAPEGYDNSPQSTVLEMQTNDSCSEPRRQNNLSHGSLSTLSFHSNKYTEGSNSALGAVPGSSKAEVAAFPKPTDDEDMCVEMSVDEPEIEVCVTPRPTKPMLHHRIASHVQNGHSLNRRGRYEDMRRSTSFTCYSPASVDDIIRVRASLQIPEHELWRSTSRSSKHWDAKRRSHSLDLRKRKERGFLTPDAWIDSLSQDDCSVESHRCTDSVFWESQSSPVKKISNSPANSPSLIQTGSHSPHAGDALALRSSPQTPIANPEVPCRYEPRSETPVSLHTAKWPGASQEAVKEAGSYMEAMKEASRGFMPNDGGLHDNEDALEVEGELESGSGYSSYASSGRGSMEPANRRLSLCQLSPTLTISPETIEEYQGCPEDKYQLQIEPSQRYWDTPTMEMMCYRRKCIAIDGPV